MTYRRVPALLGAAAATVLVVLGAQIAIARGRPYRVDVDFTIDRTVGQASGSGTPVELRVLGDSTAAGVGSDTIDTALPTLLAERVARRIGRSVHVVGHGVSGARTDHVRREQLPLVDGDADVVVVVVGSNDVIHGTPPGRLRGRTAELLRAVQARDVPVVLGGIPRFSGVAALDQPLREITDRYALIQRNAQRRAVAEVPGATFVDIAALASPRFIGRPEAMSDDDFHPSAVGYGFWADALAPAVVAALTGRHGARQR